ncbi:MAG: helix-turn-helix domain-containing protein [Candidatus Kapabacteria bacterium]|nr:helix-turn-helix domain-containing protein [Candidatus Kapabacteria bacterium]
MREDLYTANDIVQKLGVSRSTVFKWFDMGVLPRVDVPGIRHKRVRSEDLKNFLKKLGETHQEQKSKAKLTKRQMPFA